MFRTILTIVLVMFVSVPVFAEWGNAGIHDFHNVASGR